MTRRFRSAWGLFPLLALLLLTAACEKPLPVQISVGDGTTSGIFWPAGKDQSPAVLLIRPEEGADEDWQSLATKLHKAGLSVLTFDLREQGRLGRTEAVRDVRAAFAFLRLQKGVDAARIGMVGVGKSADAAFLFAAEDPLVQTAVLLAPELQWKVPSIESVLKDYGHRPLMVLTAEGDGASIETVTQALQQAMGEPVLKPYPGRAGGASLVRAGQSDVVSFLRSNLQVR